MILKEITALLQKEWQQEWRQRYALGSVLLYAGGAVFIIYLSFLGRTSSINPLVWHTIFWVLLLFTAITLAARSFINEGQSRKLYYYSLVSPQAIILSKIVYNSLFLLILAGLILLVYGTVIGYPVLDSTWYLLNVGVACVGFSCTLTMVSAIASSASASHTLMPVLSFPLLIPQLIIHLKEGKSALEGLETVGGIQTVQTIGLAVMTCLLSVLLFPFTWRYNKV